MAFYSAMASDKMSVQNAKLLAALLIAVFLALHGVHKWTSGADHCERMLRSAGGGRLRGANNVWQPDGCSLHTYSTADAEKCLKFPEFPRKRERIIFLGDARTRALYVALLKILDLGVSPGALSEYELMNDSVTSGEKNIDVRYRFLPRLNDTFLSTIGDICREEPTLIIARAWPGDFYHPFNYTYDEGGLRRFAEVLTSWAEQVDTCSGDVVGTNVLWLPHDSVRSGEYAAYHKPDPGRNSMLHEYDKATKMILMSANPNILLWQSASLVEQEIMRASGASDHNAETLMMESAARIQLQMFLNAYCRHRMDLDSGTCCRPVEAVTTQQRVTFGFYFYCLIAWIALQILKRRRDLAQNENAPLLENISNDEADASNIVPLLEPHSAKDGTKSISGSFCCNLAFLRDKNFIDRSLEIHGTLLRLGLIMTYVFVCDRTPLFMKESKHFNPLAFWLPLASMLALGLSYSTKSKFTQMLHRDQTDEWKGWMQLVILVYHITGASKILPIYMHLRVLVSAYLFMSGFGHFCFYWTKGDFGFVRYLQVMFRMNFFVVALVLTMNRPYQFYYFVPLISFWYTIVYIVLVLPPRVTAASATDRPIQYLFIILKLGGLLVLADLLHHSEVLFEQLFLLPPLRPLFVMRNKGIKEWRFRWSIDRFSMVTGCIFGLFYQLARKYKLMDDTQPGNLWTRNRFSYAALVVGLLGVSSYSVFASVCPSKPSCNEVHPYFTIVPILAFVALRNVLGSIRIRYSTVFAWFGKISLELFVGQYHMWLADDTYQVLVLVPGFPVLNVLATSFIFVFLAHEINHVTGILTSAFVVGEWKQLARNLTIFLGLLFGVSNLK